MTRYDTTPTDDERAEARELMETAYNVGRRHDLGHEFMTAGALGRLSAVVEDLTEVDDPVQARRIARARAIASAYREAL